MNELTQKIAEIDREMAKVKQEAKNRLKQLRKARRLAAKTLEQLSFIDR